MQRALAGRGDSDVPCGGCTACCRSAQFVLIGPDEVDTLAHIPRALLFPAPRMPRGHVVLGYDEQGRCPMLTEQGCSIYEHRPRTCRVYDCRVFAAAGVVPDEPGKAAIAERAARWRFDDASEADRRAGTAVRRAVAFLQAHGGDLPDALAPRSATQLAVAAVEVCEAFTGDGPPAVGGVVALLEARRRDERDGAPARRGRAR